MGTTVRATKSEAIREKTMDRARPWVSLPVMPEAKIMGQEDDDRRQGRGRDGHADLGGADLGRLLGVLAHLDVAEHVLDDDDGVVDEHADAQGQAAQGQQVQGVAGEVEGDEGRDDGQRDGQADDQGRPPVPEEEEDQDDGQQAALPGVVDRVLGHALDHVGLVHDHVELDVGRQGLGQGLELLLDGRADDGRVGPGPLADDEEDAVLAVRCGRCSGSP